MDDDERRVSARRIRGGGRNARFNGPQEVVTLVSFDAIKDDLDRMAEYDQQFREYER